MQSELNSQILKLFLHTLWHAHTQLAYISFPLQPWVINTWPTQTFMPASIRFPSFNSEKKTSLLFCDTWFQPYVKVAIQRKQSSELA